MPTARGPYRKNDDFAAAIGHLMDKDDLRNQGKNAGCRRLK